MGSFIVVKTRFFLLDQPLSGDIISPAEETIYVHVKHWAVKYWIDKLNSKTMADAEIYYPGEFSQQFAVECVSYLNDQNVSAAEKAKIGVNFYLKMPLNIIYDNLSADKVFKASFFCRLPSDVIFYWATKKERFSPLVLQMMFSGMYSEIILYANQTNQMTFSAYMNLYGSSFTADVFIEKIRSNNLTLSLEDAARVNKNALLLLRLNVFQEVVNSGVVTQSLVHSIVTDINNPCSLRKLIILLSQCLDKFSAADAYVALNRVIEIVNSDLQSAIAANDLSVGIESDRLLNALIKNSTESDLDFFSNSDVVIKGFLENLTSILLNDNSKVLDLRRVIGNLNANITKNIDAWMLSRLTNSVVNKITNTVLHVVSRSDTFVSANDKEQSLPIQVFFKSVPVVAGQKLQLRFSSNSQLVSYVSLTSENINRGYAIIRPSSGMWRLDNGSCYVTAVITDVNQNVLHVLGTREFTLDTILPTVSMTSNASTLTLSKKTAIITFNLSEASTNFTVGDVSFVGGALSRFTGAGNIYTAIFTANSASDRSASIYVLGSNFTDAARNGNVASQALSMSIDIMAPTVSIASNKSVLGLNGTALLTFGLSEESTNFTEGDVSVIGGTLSGFTGAGLNYTAVFRANQNSPISASVFVASGGFSDYVGNNNTSSQTLGMSVDIVAPTVSITSNKSVLGLGVTALLTFSLSEESTNFTSRDVRKKGVSITAFTGSGTRYTATFVIGFDAARDGVASVFVSDGAFTDIAGNINNVSQEFSVMVDTIAPTVSIIPPSTALSVVNNISILTISLSEESDDFSASDISVDGGSIVDFAGSGKNYTAKLAVNAYAANKARVDFFVGSGRFTDLAGNKNVELPRFSVSVDMVAPSVSISAQNTSLSAANNTALISFNLTEVSTNFTVGDVSFVGGVLSGFTGIGANYTAIFTAKSNSTLAASVYVAPGSFTDNALNKNKASQVFSMSVDTALPEILITTDKSLLGINGTALLTFSLTELLNNFVGSDIGVIGGDISCFTGADKSFTAIFTPSGANYTSASIYVLDGKFVDTVGNVNALSSIVLGVDTVAPTVRVSATDMHLRTMQEKIITFSLSEESNDFTANNLSISGGEISGFTGHGTNYTAIFTPVANSSDGMEVSIARPFKDLAGNSSSADHGRVLLRNWEVIPAIHSVACEVSSTAVLSDRYVTYSELTTVHIFLLDGPLPSSASLQIQVVDGGVGDNVWLDVANHTSNNEYSLSNIVFTKNASIRARIVMSSFSAPVESYSSRIFSIIPNRPKKIWIPGFENLVAAHVVDPTVAIQMIVNVADTGAVVGDKLFIVSSTDERTLWEHQLTQDEVDSGYALVNFTSAEQFTIPFNLKVAISNYAGNKSLYLDAITNGLDGVSLDYYNKLSESDLANLTSNFLAVMANTPNLINGLNARFFNLLNLNSLMSLGANFFNQISRYVVHDLTAVTLLNIVAILQDSTPRIILDNITISQVESMSVDISQYIASSYFKGEVNKNIIIGLAKRSTESRLAMTDAQFSSLSEGDINLFLGIYLNKTKTTTAFSAALLNLLTENKVNALYPEFFAQAMPLDDIRNGLLSAKFFANISAVGFSFLSNQALSALSEDIKKNPTKYSFSANQLQSLDYNGLRSLLSSYHTVEALLNQTKPPLPHNILNNLSADQFKNININIIQNNIFDLNNADLNINVLSSLGGVLYSRVKLFPNQDAIWSIPKISEFNKLNGDKLVAYFKEWGNPVGGSYEKIPKSVCYAMTAAQIASLPADFIKHNIAASSLLTDQLNAITPAVIDKLGLTWLSSIPKDLILYLSGDFLNAIPADVFKLLGSDFISNIDATAIKKISATTIKEIASHYIGGKTAFKTYQVSNFTQSQLEALFMGSVSDDTGDYIFSDLSDVLSGINIELDDPLIVGEFEDELANIPLYILRGTSGDEYTRLAHGRVDLNSLIREQEGIYSSGDKSDVISMIRSLLFRANDLDLRLLSLDTINILSTLNDAGNANWETIGRLSDDENNNEIAKSIKSLLLEKFNVFGKSIISGANDAIIAAIGQKMISDIAAGVTSTVISDAQFRSLQNHQLSVLLSQWTNSHVTIPSSVLAKLSVTQIGDLSPTTLAMFVDTANLSQAPDSFIIGLGYIAKELNNFSAHMQNLGWWSSGDTPRRSFPLTATQLQNFTPAQLNLFLSPWTDDPRNPPLSAFVLKMLSNTQIAGLDDIVYQNLTFDEVNAILPRIPVSKINLLNPTAFMYSDVDALVGKAWPSAAQLAVMNADQVNVLFTMWRNNTFYSSNTRLTGTNKLMAINDSSISVVRNNFTWYYAVNSESHLIEKKYLNDTSTISPSDELFRSSVFALSNATRENILVDQHASLLPFDPQNSDLGSYIATLSFDEDTINIIHSLPFNSLAFLNDDVIDLIARDDELSLGIGDNMFFNQTEFSMLTVDQVKKYISSYLDEASQTHSGNNLPLAVLNAFSPTQVQSLTTDQFNSISANTIALLSDAFVMGMTTNQIALLISSNKLQYLRLDQIPFIDANVIANLGTRLSNFTTDQLNSLRPDQIRAIGTVVPTSESDALTRAYLNSAEVQEFIDGNLTPDQYAFLNKDMFAHLTQIQMQKISPELIPYISKEIIAQLETNGKLNNFTNEQIWQLSNEQINAAFPNGQAVPNPLRLSAQVGLAFDQTLYSALEASNNGQMILTSLTPAEVISIPPDVLAEFSNIQLAQLTNAQIFNLSLAQIMALGHTKYAVLAKTPGPALALNAAQIGALSADQINALTAKTIGSFSAAQFKALLHHTVVPFANLDPSLLQFVDAPALNALNGNELNMWSQDQIAALSLDTLGNLSDYNKSIVRAIMGMQDDQVSGARLLQSASSPLDGIYGGFNLPAVPVRTPAAIINKNTNLAWTQDKIQQIALLKGLETGVNRPDYYVSNVDLAKTYLTPYRDVTWMRYILLDNLYSSSKYDISGSISRYVGSPARQRDGTIPYNSASVNTVANQILQTRKYLQFGRLFGSILLMMGSVDVFKNAWNLRDVRSTRDTVSDFLLGIGWIASGIQVPWGMFWSTFTTKDGGKVADYKGWGGLRYSTKGEGFKAYFRQSGAAFNDYFGINRPFSDFDSYARSNSATVVPAPPSTVAVQNEPVNPAVQGVDAGAGVGIVVDGRTIYSLNVDILAAQEKQQALTTKKIVAMAGLRSAIDEVRRLEDLLTDTKSQIDHIEQRITELQDKVIDLSDGAVEALREKNLADLYRQKSSLNLDLQRNKILLTKSLERTQRIGAVRIHLNIRIRTIKDQLNTLNNEMVLVQAASPAEDAAAAVRPATPVTVNAAATTEVAAIRTRTIRVFETISKKTIRVIEAIGRKIPGGKGLTFTKNLKWQGIGKGGGVFMLANLMGAINGMANIVSGVYDAIDANKNNDGEAKADAGMRIFTGLLSFTGGVSLFFGDNIDALADAGDVQKALGARYTNIALALGYISQATSILYKEWATYGRNQNGWEPAAFKTGTIVLRIGLLYASWLARTNLWGSIITTVALTVVPFLLDNAVEYYLSQNYLDDLRDTLNREGRTTEADLWIPVLKRIENHASQWGQLDIVTFKQNQLNDLSAKMLANNAENLKSVLSQQKAATMLRTADGLAFLTDTINGMISSNSNTNTTDAKVSDLYVLEMGTASKKNYYVMQTGLNDKKFGYVSQSHLSVHSLLSSQTSLSTTFSSTATTDQLSSYFAVDTTIGNDLDSTGGSIVLTDQASGNGVALVQLVFNQAYYDLTQQNFTVDARTATKNMIFTVATHTTILAGSGLNTFNVDQSSVEASSFQIVAKDILKNEINFTNHTIDSTTYEAVANNINLDKFSNMRVVQHDVNYGAGNTATGSLYGQYYVAGFGGKNTITMTGGGANIVANGRGNTVTLGGDNNTAYINLLSDVSQNYAYQAMANGNYSGSANAINNIMNFSGTNVSGDETFNVDINGLTNAAAIKNAGVVIDAVNFTNFQQLEGSNNGSIINITGNTQLSSLILNDARAVGRYNIVNLQDVSGLAIVSSGKSIITINESNPENNTISANTNYIYLQGSGGSKIYANANTITGARLDSDSDSIIFAQGARFNLLEVGQGTHTINFKAHNSSQVDSGVNGLIRMVDSSIDSHLIVQDEDLRGTIEDTLMIQLANGTHVDDYNVSYRYNATNNQNEVYFESTTGTKSLNYLTVNTDITSDSYAEVVVLGAANTIDENTYYDSDINTIIEAITELTISNTTTSLQFSGYTGYSFNTVLTKVLELNSIKYVDNILFSSADITYSAQDNLYTLTSKANNLQLFDSYDDVTNIFSNYSGTGNARSNRIIGSFGNNTLDGGGGADVLIGANGDDIYIVDNAGDVVVEYGNQGKDTIKSSVNYTLTNNVENLTLIGSNNINATGNDGDNILTGNSGNNSLIGGAGNDTLFGIMGSDVDTLIGGTGDDVYIINTLTSNVVVENVGGGKDTVQTTLAIFSLSNANHQFENIENLVYTGTTTFNGTGNSLDNIFSVSILSSAVQRTFDGNDGKDTIDYSNATTALSVTLNSSNSGTARGAVNDILKNIENVIGGFGSDSILGDSQDNLLIGGSGNDSIIGGVGNDTLKGGSDNDILDGGDGIDTVDYSDAITGVIVSLALTTVQITVGSGTDTLSNIENVIGSGYRDKLIGSADNNVLDGGADNDTLDGGIGNDTLIGGAGNDVYIVDSTGDVIIENTSANSGIDTIKTTLTTLTLTSSYQGIENLSYQDTNNFTGTGNGSDNVLTGNVGNDTLIAGDGDDTLIGGAGNNSLIGGAGNDVYKIDSTGDVIVESGGTDTIETNLTTLTLTSSYQGIENLSYQGTNNFTGTGSSNSNVLTGNEGDDTLDGAAGDDTLIGGKGNDTYIVNEKNETITERNNEGIDTVRTTLAQYTLANIDNVENITYVGTASAYLIGNVLDNVFFGTTIANANGNDTYDGGFGKDTVDYSNIGIAMNINLVSGTATGAGTDKLINIENIIGGAGNDLITGNATDNLLYGGAGNNTLVGGVGNDVLESGVGNDTLDGGADIDTVSYRRATTGVTVNLATGVATGFGADKLIAIENITGSDFADNLTGSAGDNILDGSAGADSLSGGLGNDTYIVDNTADQINEDSVTGSGIDTVKVKANLDTYTLGLNLENLIYMGTGAFTGIGNGLNNALSGSSDNDTLSGLGGDDTLDGGLGNDSLVGGDGNDVYIVDSTDDVIVEASTANAGTDLARTRLSRLVLAENVENLIYAGVGSFVGTGNRLSNVITGGAYADILDGGAGSDTLIGGAGDDVYIVNTNADWIVESNNEGNDTVETSLLFTIDLSAKAYANVENINYTGTNAFSGKGNAGDNVFSGGIGNDSFDGSGGIDTIDYSQSDNSVIVTLTNTNGSATGADIGIDTLMNIENVVGGSARDTITGNDGNNLLLGGIGSDTIGGGNGNDTLEGGYGEDSLVGGNGNDIYIVDNTKDTLVESTSGGIDTILTDTLYQLDLRNYQNIENLQYIGVGNFVGIGDQYNNVLTGGIGDDTLDGASGADTFVGGDGDDIYYINSTDDVVIEASISDAGSDTVITALTSLTLFDNVENLTYTGTANFNATGNSSDNILTGGSADDSLNGAAGNDILLGGDGNDSLVGGDGNDVLEGGAGIDTLIGAAGNDVYNFSQASGIDTIMENDTTSGNLDILNFMDNTTKDQLWFTHVDNNLEVSIIGTTDKVVIINWYLGDQYKIETIKTSQSTLAASAVANLVSAMASVTAPASGVTTLPSTYTSIVNAINAAWH